MNLNKLEKNISHICNSDYSYFLNKKNVVGVGVGYKIKNGFCTCNLCLQIFVMKKLPIYKLLSTDIIPVCFKGIKTDVVETGIFKTSSLKQRKRPVIGGYSIGPNLYNINGSSGCIVSNGINKFILCNNHVLANTNELPIGSVILQPSYIFGGSPRRDTIGILNRYVPIRFINGEQRPENFSDCATGLLTPQNIMNPEIAFIGKPTCVKRPVLNAEVKKVGDITELTEGRITNISAHIITSYPNGQSALFSNTIITTKMSEDGDSGSILINKNMCAIGLLFGHSDTSSIYNRLDITLDQLDVNLFT